MRAVGGAQRSCKDAGLRRHHELDLCGDRPERHKAPRDRGRMKGPALRYVAAARRGWRQPEPGDLTEGGSSLSVYREITMAASRPDGLGSSSETRRWNLNDPSHLPLRVERSVRTRSKTSHSTGSRRHAAQIIIETALKSRTTITLSIALTSACVADDKLAIRPGPSRCDGPPRARRMLLTALGTPPQHLARLSWIAVGGAVSLQFRGGFGDVRLYDLSGGCVVVEVEQVVEALSGG